MQFLFVSPNVCRQLLSDSPSRRTPLLLANTPYCKAHSGLTPYSLYPCLTHKAEPRFCGAVLIIIQSILLLLDHKMEHCIF